MTSSAGAGNVYLRDGRLRIGRRQNVVAFMAIGADRRAGVTASDRFRVNALSIRQERTLTDPTALHYSFVAMTPAASFGDVAAIDCRLRIAGRQDGSQITVSTVTVHARRCFRTVLDRLRVEAMIVISMYLRVELRAGKVRKFLAAAVTTLALQQIVLSRRAVGCRSC